MGSTEDKVTGHVKETVGELTGNETLENEGEADRRAGEIKERFGDAVDAVKDKVHAVLHKD